MNGSLGKHGVVLDLRLAKRRAVTSNEDELGYKQGKQNNSLAQGTFSASRSSPRRREKEFLLTLAAAHLLQRRLVAKGVLSRLHNEGQTRGDGLVGLGRFGFLAGGHCECQERLGGA